MLSRGLIRDQKLISDFLAFWKSDPKLYEIFYWKMYGKDFESILNFLHLLLRGWIKELKLISDLIAFWWKQSSIKLLTIIENYNAKISHLLLSGLIKELKRISDFLVLWQKESSIKVLMIVENSKVDYLEVFLIFHAC